MAVQVKNLSTEQIDEIARAIGDSFYDHDYGEREKGIAKYITDREMMTQYMKVFVVAGMKSGTLYATSERGEGYIMLMGSKWEKMKLGAAIGMLKDMIKALGGFKKSLDFLNTIKKGGVALDDKLKKEKKDYLQVVMLVVRKEYQGQGYMRQLMEFAYEKADTYGVPCILDTDAKNKLDKYCHLGMEHVATRKVAADCYLYDLMRKKK
ncbi:MAG: GNAT family N-acetyltransferase [Lachnospiraceae bacterium]|nr:GNAT family N-acetyltransferase [Lachnospiraceae bacterium]